MRRRILTAVACCAAAGLAIGAARPVPLGGWAPRNTHDAFVAEGLGLSTEADFTVAARVTLPGTLPDKAAVLSLGEPDVRQVTLTVSPALGYAYLSSADAAGVNTLLGEWKVPVAAIDPATAAGKTFDLALTHRVGEGLTLWVDGARQALTLNTAAQNADDDPARPAFKKTATLPALRLAGRLYGTDDGAHHLAGGAYANVAVFDHALGEEAVCALHALAEGETVESGFLADAGGAVAVTLTPGSPTVWDADWDGRDVVLSGEGVLETPGGAAPAALFLAPGTALTVRAEPGRGLSAQTLSVGEGVTVRAAFTAYPESSGAYGVLAARDGATCPLDSAAFPEARPGNVWIPEDAIAGGAVSVAVIGRDGTGAWLLREPADYEWFLSEGCPADATVRLAGDLTLAPGAYAAKPLFRGVFDGQGHTLTLPEGACVSDAGGGAGLIAGRWLTQAGEPASEIRDLRVVIDGEIRSDAGVYAGGVVGGCGVYGGALTLSNLWVRLNGRVAASAAGGLAGGVVGGSWGTGRIDLTGLRLDLGASAMVSGAAQAAGVVGSATGLAGSDTEMLTLADALLVFQAGAAIEAPARAAVMRQRKHANAGHPAARDVTVVDFGQTAPELFSEAVSLGGVTCRLGSGAVAAPPAGVVAFAVADGPLPLRDAEEACLAEGAPLRLPASLPEGFPWALSAADETGFARFVPRVGLTDLDAVFALGYAFEAAQVGEGRVFDGWVDALCHPTLLCADGWAELREPADYAWFVSEARDATTLRVRLARDILLEERDYALSNGLTAGLLFDGQGHTLTLPRGATVSNPGRYSYAGLLGATLGGGATVRDVTLVVEGTVTAGTHAGAVAGTTVYGASAPAALDGVRVLLGPGSSISAPEGLGALVGKFGGAYGGLACSGCVLADRGVALTGGASGAGYGVPGGVAVLRGGGADAAYGEGETFLDGAAAMVERGGVTLLTGEAAWVADVAAPEGWRVALAGNVATVAAPEGLAGGAAGALTYWLAGFPTVPLTVTLAQPALSGPLPAGLTARQASILRAFAAERGLASPGVAFRAPADASPEALECFTGILRAEGDALVVGYDFGVRAIRPSADGASLEVTVGVADDSGTPAGLAEGAALSLVGLDGKPLAREPEPVAGGWRFRLPRQGGTCLFRALAEPPSAAP